MNYRIIDTENWKRKTHFEIFRKYQQPRYDISFELDITNFHARLKEKGLPFTTAFIYAVAKTADEIEEFRYRFQDGNVVIFDELKLSFTYLNQETKLLKNVVVEPKDTLEEFAVYAQKAAQNQKEYFTGPMGNDIYQFSSIPWISYTHISHTDSGKPDNATPMFDFGKYELKNGKLLLPFSIEAHHSFVDGIHMGELAEKLQLFLDRYQ